MTNCPNCSRTVEPGWKLCPECGTTLAAVPGQCPSCSADVQPDWKLCPSCGKRLKAESEAPAAGASATAAAGDVSFSDRPATVMNQHGSGDAAAVESSTERYAVERELGRGGMGVVYRARDTLLGRSVALKRLLATAGEETLAVQRFLTEAKAVAALNHPNILTVFDIGADQEGHFIAMELVDGLPLDQLMKEGGGRLPESRAIELFRGICAGIEYAHRQGVIHRDIKPGNILVTYDGVPKVADFGLARLGVASGLSISGFGMGTMDYAAPEQKRDAKSVDHRADIYSLGCTFYEMLTGHRPPPHPDQLPPVWRELVLKATHPEPARRQFAVTEILRALGEPAAGAAWEAKSEPPKRPSSVDIPGAEQMKAWAEKLTKPGAWKGGIWKRWYEKVKPWNQPPDPAPAPSLLRALYHQLSCRGLRYLGVPGKRWVVWYVFHILTFVLLVACIGDEFYDEDLILTLIVMAAGWFLGFVDVLVTWNRVRVAPYAAPPAVEAGPAAAPGPAPSLARALVLQLGFRGLRSLGVTSKRWLVYFIFFILAVGGLFVCIDDDFYDEELVTGLLVLVAGWLLGFVDVYMTWLRIRLRR